MGSKTDYLENAVLNYWLRANVGGLTSPATVYVGLFTATPSDTGGGTEVAGSGYARQVIAFSAPSPAGTMVNSAIIDFPAATGSGWGTVTHFAIFDALTVGNMLYWGDLDVAKVISLNDIFRFTASSVTITEDLGG